MRTSPATYSRLQITLHWLVVVGVAFQIGFHEFIVTATEQVARGAVSDGLTLAISLAHVASGLTIGVATLARLALRLTRGVPAHAGDTPAWQAAIASIVHWAFYVLLLAMVTTGVLTFLRVAPLGQVHFIINGALVVTIGLHVAGALFNQFVRHDGTLMRMFGRHA